MHFKMVIYKWFVKYFHCIQARYEHFLTYSQCQRHTAHKFEHNETRTTDADYEHINTKKWELENLKLKI